MNEKVKSGNIAIHKDKLKEMLNDNQLELVTLIDGFWKTSFNTSTSSEYQDILVFKKK